MIALRMSHPRLLAQHLPRRGEGGQGEGFDHGGPAQLGLTDHVWSIDELVALLPENATLR